MPNNNDPLQLRYVFTSDPQFIRASADGNHTNTVNLDVMISIPSGRGIAIKAITINIPTGEESSRSISDDRDLPFPVRAGSGDWQVSSAGGAITVKPASGSQFTIADKPVEFTLKDIRVNQTPGAVPITITELPPSGSKRVDSSSYELKKREADFPVGSFRAVPGTLYDLDQSVTLYWECTEQGKKYTYNAHSDSWRPRSCPGGNDCYTWQDGERGVQTAKLTDTTTFALDVIRGDSLGHRSIYKTLRTKVEMRNPFVSSSSHSSKLLFGGFVILYWLANNSRICTLRLNGEDVDTLAPTDTYLQGYPVALLGRGTIHQFELVAFAQSGAAQAQFTFPIIQTDPTCHIPHNLATSAMAVTPDGKLALVTGSPVDQPPANSPGVWIFDLERGRLEPDKIYAGKIPNGIAITPNGSQAYVTDYFGNKVTIIDLAKRQPEPDFIHLPDTPSCIAITPDGALALVGSRNNGGMMVIDTAKRHVEASPITVSGVPVAIAVSPDGKSAIVGLADGSASKIDIAGRKADNIADWNVKGLTGLAITQDGKRALVIDDHNLVTALNLDLNDQTFAPQSFKAPGRAIFMLITMPDGRIAISGSKPPNNFIEVV
jgi:hypothetical protein